MTEDVPHGANCEDCPQRSSFGDPAKSEYPASTRCFWCRKLLCSVHSELPFERLGVRSCVPCGRFITDAHRERDGVRFLLIPRKWPPLRRSPS